MLSWCQERSAGSGMDSVFSRNVSPPFNISYTHASVLKTAGWNRNGLSEISCSSRSYLPADFYRRGDGKSARWCYTGGGDDGGDCVEFESHTFERHCLLGICPFCWLSRRVIYFQTSLWHLTWYWSYLTCSGVLPDKLILELVKKSPAIYGTGRFIAVFAGVRHWTLYWDTGIKSSFSWRWIVIFSSAPVSLRYLPFSSSDWNFVFIFNITYVLYLPPILFSRIFSPSYLVESKTLV